MNINLKTQSDFAADRYALLEKLGIEYSAEFVPQSKSRNSASKYKSLNWKVTIKRGNQSLTTDYMQGIGHAAVTLKGIKNSLHNDAILRDLVETGSCREDGATFGRIIKQPAPDRNDVLYSLCGDSEALDYPTFEEWADTFGCNPDSRSAEKTYRDCLEIALKMRAIFGDADLAKLRETFQDY